MASKCMREEDPTLLEFKSRICMHSIKDTNVCWITAMVFYQPCSIYVTDYNNKALKMANTSFNKLSDRISLDGHPWDITGMFHDTVAVTLPNEKRIQLVDVTAKGWRIKRTLRFDKQYWGIGHCKPNFIVSSLSPPALHVMNRQGEVLKTIRKNDRDEEIFRRPMFIQTNYTSIVVSDRDKKAVIVLDLNCKVQNYYRTNSDPRIVALAEGGSNADPRGVALAEGGSNADPRGVALAEGGSMFVSTINGNEKNVIAISKKGSQRFVKLDSLDDPYALSYFFQGRELFASSYSEIAKLDNYVYMYKRCD
ncbi:uncharacterized protein LOC132756925 [Ruditapes philippinarum]|uniref:uncharacterized protein LOC132756925 n=1 Tax=Ruditapes philippinarum TaxID=129788 RepID=UPI00295B8AC1|nr:uncharacterized protein LOC132756925 [Ruditapes philippinarum]